MDRREAGGPIINYHHHSQHGNIGSTSSRNGDLQPRMDGLPGQHLEPN